MELPHSSRFTLFISLCMVLWFSERNGAAVAYDVGPMYTSGPYMAHNVTMYGSHQESNQSSIMQNTESIKRTQLRSGSRGTILIGAALIAILVTLIGFGLRQAKAYLPVMQYHMDVKQLRNASKDLKAMLFKWKAVQDPAFNAEEFDKLVQERADAQMIGDVATFIPDSKEKTPLSKKSVDDLILANDRFVFLSSMSTFNAMKNFVESQVPDMSATAMKYDILLGEPYTVDIPAIEKRIATLTQTDPEGAKKMQFFIEEAENFTNSIRRAIHIRKRLSKYLETLYNKTIHL